AGKVTPKTKEPPCKHKGGRLSDWRAWREAGPKKPPAVIARLACLLVGFAHSYLATAKRASSPVGQQNTPQ
ncbi:hypothetical protein MRX96_053989, partial [Rhipicephalus microplus]